MKKLTLAPDELAVQTFEPVAAVQEAGGTVKGHETGEETCYDMGCPLSYWTDCHRC